MPKMNQFTGIPKTHFSTDFFSEKDRMEAYRETIGTVFDVSNINSTELGMTASLESYLLQEIMLVETKTVAQNFFRTPATVARNNLDHFLIQLFFEGFTAFKKDGAHHFCDSSSLVVIDTARTWDAFNPHFHHLTLVIPRRLLAGKLWHYDSHHGRLLKSNINPFVGLLEELMLSLYKNLDRIEADQSGKIMGHTMELVISTLNFASYFERMTHRRHEKLMNKMMKTQHAISRSALKDFFQAEGLTSFLQEQSLKKAYRKISGLPDPDERFLIQPQIVSPVIQLASGGTSPYRLWEEWMLAL